MDIRALVLVGGAASEPAGTNEKIAGRPIADLDVLGAPLIDRVLERLSRVDISVSVIIESSSRGELQAAERKTDVPHQAVAADQFWDTAEEAFRHCAEDGADLVIVLRMGAYIEADYEELIQHHLDRRDPVTQAVDSSNSALELFVISASARTDAAELFASGMQRLRRECEPFQVTGYVNRLSNAADLRRLTVDGLLAKNAVHPRGNEYKPGIWIGRGASIHRKARVVAPAFIGARAKIRASALITRGSVIEHHAEVDCGTVVENSSVLPFTRLGAGLDVTHAVVGYRRLAHLVRGVEVEISDATFVDMVPLTPVSRLAGSTAAFFAFIPKQIYRGILAPSHRKSSASVEASPEEVRPELGTPALEQPASGDATEFPSSLAVVRRYGDH